jgi:phospholipase C
MNAGNPDPIKHVVLLLLENHSFDQMMGSLKSIYPTLEGVDPNSPGMNVENNRKQFFQQETTERQVMLDPHHEVNHVAVQLSDNNGGFIKDYVSVYPNASEQDRQDIMGYYPADFLPGLHTLARHFTICDHWFASLPGPTWPNRFFALSGTSSGQVDMPDDGTHKADLGGYLEQSQPTLFDRLTEKNIDWRIYYHDIPQSLVFIRQREPENAARYFPINAFFKDASGRASDFPDFTYIEPRYQGQDQNDDHPPHDIMKAQKLIADVYNALRANDELWKSTLFVLFYDEHGGFYDHIVPPAAVPPDPYSHGYDFKQLGIRVPALLISPWVENTIDKTIFDHTSFLNYASEKWGLADMGERVKNANNFASAIRAEWAQPRNDTPSKIELTPDQLTPPNAALEKEAAEHKNAHQYALMAFGNWVDLAAPQGFFSFVRVTNWISKHPELLAIATEVNPAIPFFLNFYQAQQKITKFIAHQKAKGG